MAGDISVDPAEVKKMLGILSQAESRLIKLQVTKPKAGVLGQSGSGRGLEALMTDAVERILSTLSDLTKALIDMQDGVNAAEKAVTGSDEEAAAYAAKMQAAVELTSHEFFENLGKDKRVQVGDVPLFPGLGDALSLGLTDAAESGSQGS